MESENLNDKIIITKNLTKKFGDFVAVDSLNLKIERGEIFGFLGPNGAGKTTTIKMLLGLIFPTSGKIIIDGVEAEKNFKEVKRKIGYVPEKVEFYSNLTPLQTLNFFCELKDVEKSVAEDLLKEVGLHDVINKKVGTFSKGMTQLLGIAQAMIGNPSIYILDEPMGGLDARWVKIVREKIKGVNANGATVVFSSHILSEVQNLCHKVAIINKGRLIAEDTVEKLSRHFNIKPRLEIYIEGLNGVVPEDVLKIEGVEEAEAEGNKLSVICSADARVTVLRVLEGRGMKVNDFRTVEPSLEEAFVKLISEED